MKTMFIRVLPLLCVFCLPQYVYAGTKSNDSFVFERQQGRGYVGVVQHCLMRKDSNGVLIPRVIVDDNQIAVLNDTGTIEKTITIHNANTKDERVHVYQGKFGKTLGVQITRGYSSTQESWTSGEYYILNENGEKTLDLKKFDDNTRPIPSPSGDYAVGWPEEGTPGGPPIFYDANGIRNKWAHGFSGEGWPKMYGTFDATFSPDGKYVAILAGNGDAAENPMMIVYDAHGNKLFEKMGASKGFLFSPDASRIAYYSATDQKLGMVGIDGRQLWETSLQVLPRVFSADGSLLLTMTTNSIAVINAVTGKLVWEWKADTNNLKGQSFPRGPHSWDGFVLGSVAATPDFSRVIATAATLKDTPVIPGKPQLHAVSDRNHLLVFNKDGHLIHWEDFSKDNFQLPSAQIGISNDGNNITILMNNGIVSFSLKKGDFK
jgi:outer membrane protein assembly factor BamB